jgi:hypothetical protein
MRVRAKQLREFEEGDGPDCLGGELEHLEDSS